MNAIVDRFARLAAHEPGRPLIHVPATGRTFTAADLDDRREAHQRTLLSLSVGSGDLVLSAAGNHAGTISLLVACWSIGAPVLLVDAGTPRAEIWDLASRFEASAVVMGPGQAAGVETRPLDDELLVAPRTARSQSAYRGASLLKLTSGSSGTPKAVLAAGAQLLADGEHILEAMGIAADDVQLVAIPLAHAYGFGNLVMPLLLQGTAMVLRESFGPQQVTADAGRYGARVFHGVPYMYQHFLSHPPTGGWPASLRLLISAGAPLELETVQAFRARFGVKIHSFYGTSESGGIAYDAGDDVDVATVGPAMPGVAISLRPDPDVPSGYGRVHVQGDGVCERYVGDVEEGVEFREGGFLTGDYGHVLDDGRLVLAGRVSSFINVAGRKVQPGEIERILRKIDGVTDARVLAADDPARGEQIAAVVSGHSDLTLAAVRQHCAQRLAPYKVPRVVVVVDQLPVTARGKADYRALSALVQLRIEQGR